MEELDDFKIASGDSDVRGWAVLSSDGRMVGAVDDLLVDTAAMKIRFLDVDLDQQLLAGAGERHILIPIAYARLHEDDDRVFVDSLNAAQLRQLPTFGEGPLPPEYIDRLQNHLDRERRPAPADPTAFVAETGSGSRAKVSDTSGGTRRAPEGGKRPGERRQG